MFFPVFDAKKSIFGATIVNTINAFEYSPTAELGAQHWLFGGDSASLTPFFGSATLTPQSTTEVFGDNYVETQSFAEGLLTNIFDTSDTFTYCAVVEYRPDATGNKILLGTLNEGSADGFGMWLSADGNLVVILRSNTPPSFVINGDNYTVGEYLFIAYSEYVYDGQTFVEVRVNDQTFTTEFTGLRARNETRSVALGNAYVDSANYYDKQVKFAEFIAFPTTFKTQDETNEIYYRSKLRMASRGIEI